MNVANVQDGKAGTNVVVPYQNHGSDVAGQSTANSKQADVRQWTIKGLAPETVEVSREAARRSGMKLNSWVGQALQRAAETPREILQHEQLPEMGSSDIRELREEISKLRAQGEALEQTVNSMSALLLKLYVNTPK